MHRYDAALLSTNRSPSCRLSHELVPDRVQHAAQTRVLLFSLDHLPYTLSGGATGPAVHSTGSSSCQAMAQLQTDAASQALSCVMF